MSWRDLGHHGAARDAAFYLSALTYAQYLWQRGYAGRALLSLDRALLANLRGNEPVLRRWPLPYVALHWVMTHAPAKALVGNPRVHYQHLAGRLRGPGAHQKKARAWACWHLARRANPEWPGDLRHKIREPSVAETKTSLQKWGLKAEARIWEENL
jgi:hypothetical protein